MCVEHTYHEQGKKIGREREKNQQSQAQQKGSKEKKKEAFIFTHSIKNSNFKQIGPSALSHGTNAFQMETIQSLRLIIILHIYPAFSK